MPNVRRILTKPLLISSEHNDIPNVSFPGFIARWLHQFVAGSAIVTSTLSSMTMFAAVTVVAFGSA